MSDQVSAWKQIALSLALLAGAAVAWYQHESLAAYFGFSEETARGAVTHHAGAPVIVAPVRVAADALVLEAVGTGRAQRSIMLRVESAGKVAAMPMRPGQRYAQGDVLLRLDDTEQRLAVALAKARLAEAERVRARVQRLAKSGTVSTVRLQEARTAAEIARIQIEKARAELEDRILRAPFSGVVGFSGVEVGDRIDGAVGIAGFDARGVILVGVDLPEAMLGRVHPGMAVTATTPAVPGRRFEGSIAMIDSRVAVESRTVRVRVAIPNSDDLLRPGGSFTVRLELPGPRYPVVPELALQFTRGALCVWRIDDGNAERVEVRLIRRRGGQVLVEGPLDKSDLVVVEGTQRLAPGEKVAIVGTENGAAI